LKKRGNISNLPADRLQTKPTIPTKPDMFGVNKPKGNFFAAWNDNEKRDIDMTTEQVLGEKETFDLLAERGYETLENYQDGKENKVL